MTSFFAVFPAGLIVSAGIVALAVAIACLVVRAVRRHQIERAATDRAPKKDRKARREDETAPNELSDGPKWRSFKRGVALPAPAPRN